MAKDDLLISTGIRSIETHVPNMWKCYYRCSSCKLQVSKLWDKNDKKAKRAMAGPCACGNREWLFISDEKYAYPRVEHKKRKTVAR